MASVSLLDASRSSLAVVGMDEVDDRRADQLAGRVCAEQAGRRRVGEDVPVVGVDQDGFGAQVDEPAVATLALTQGAAPPRGVC